VLIQGPDGPFAKLLLENLDEVAELDANTEEVATTIKGLSPTLGAVGPEWDKALGGCSQREREQAEVYFLPT
jgi:hypothetical protein